MAGQKQPSQRRNDRLYLVMLQHERAGNQLPMGRSVYVQPSGRAVRADSDIQSLSDLAGKRIGVQATTKAESLFLGEISSLLPEVKQVNSFETTEDMFAALRKGYVDAVAGHEALVAKWTKLDESGYRVLSESPYSSELGVAFAKDTHEDLAVQLTQTLEDMKQDGTIGRVAEKFGLDAEKTVWGEQGK